MLTQIRWDICPRHNTQMVWQSIGLLGWVCRECQAAMTTTTKANTL